MTFTYETRSGVKTLGYEQCRALHLLRLREEEGREPYEGSALCSEAGCSWAEMFDLHPVLIDIGEDLVNKRLRPRLQYRGRELAVRVRAHFNFSKEL